MSFKKAKEKPDGTKSPIDIATPTYGYQNHVLIVTVRFKEEETGAKPRLHSSWLRTPMAD
jgi:hypothetical protein